MENKYKYLLKNTSLLTISNFSSKILVFFLVPFYTNILSTAEYGTYDLIQTTISLLIPILSANIAEAVMRYLMDDKVNQNDVVYIGLKYELIAIVIAGVLILGNYWFGLWSTLKEYSFLTFILFSFSILHQYSIQYAKGIERIREMAIAGIFGTVVKVLANILFLVVFKWKLNGFFTAYILGEAVPTFYIFISTKYQKYLNHKNNCQLEKVMVGYSTPLIFNSLGWWVNSVSDRYVVTLLCGVAVNGIYSISYKIPMILSTVQQIFIQAWQISAIKEYSTDGAKRFYGEALRTLNFVMCIGCMGLIILSKVIARFLYANDFYLAWQFVPFLLLSSVIDAASGILGPVLIAKRDSKSMGFSALVGAVINIVLNFLLVYFIGAQGAAIATAVSSFVIYIARKKAVGNDIQYIKYPSLIISWVLIIVQCILMIWLGYVWLQMILICIVIILHWDVVIKLREIVTTLGRKRKESS